MKHLLLTILMLPSAGAHSNQASFYDCYGTSERFVIEGRVIKAENRTIATLGDRWYGNFWRNLRMLNNAEQEGVKLSVKMGNYEAHTVTDEEGYFRLTLAPEQHPTPGWHPFIVRGERALGEGRLLIVPKTNTVGVISDIDDTVLVSDVLHKKKLLAHTFLRNAMQRETFPGTADFYRRLLAQNPDPQSAPMFYVSASPRQLTDNISAFLTQNNFPEGVLVTKQIAGAGRDPLLNQLQYKITKIENIFKALPWVKYVLIGDDGELDPEAYRTLQEKYPQRVAAIYIRKVSHDPRRKAYAGQLDLAAATQP